MPATALSIPLRLAEAASLRERHAMAACGPNDKRVRGHFFMRRLYLLAAALLLAASLPASATVFATRTRGGARPAAQADCGSECDAAGSGFRFCPACDDQCRWRIRVAGSADRRVPADGGGHRICQRDRDFDGGIGNQSGPAYSARSGGSNAVGGGAMARQAPPTR